MRKSFICLVLSIILSASAAQAGLFNKDAHDGVTKCYCCKSGDVVGKTLLADSSSDCIIFVR